MSFGKNIAKLASGAIIAQALGVLLSPIIARLFAPEAFGEVAIFSSITGVIGVVACLRYELALMLPKPDEEAVNLFAACLMFALSVAFISGLLTLFAKRSILEAFNITRLGNIIWLAPFAIFLSGNNLTLSHWNIRKKHFGRLSIARVVNSVVMQISKLTLGFLGFVTGDILIFAGIFGRLISDLFLAKKTWDTDKRLFSEGIKTKKIFSGIKRYKSFPLYDSWSAFLNNASQHMPAFLLAYFFSTEIVGFFSIGRRVIIMPMSLIGGAVGRVFFQRAAKAKHQGQLGRVVEDIFQRLVALSMFPFICLSFLGKDLFSLVLGARWAEAGFYMQMLAPLNFFVFISSPLSNLFSVLEELRTFLIFNIFLIICRATALIIGGLWCNPRQCMALFAGISIFPYMWMCFWLISKAKADVGKSAIVLAQYFFISLPLMAIILGFHYVIRCHFIYTLGACLFCAVLYYSFVIYRDIYLQSKLLICLKKIHILE